MCPEHSGTRVLPINYDNASCVCRTDAAFEARVVVMTYSLVAAVHRTPLWVDMETRDMLYSCVNLTHKG